MNLHAIVSGAIGTVNPFAPFDVKVSTGYTNNPDATRTPLYTTVSGVMGQVQSLTFRDLQQLEGLNLQGIRRAIYLDGRIDGLVRPAKKGGDLIIGCDGSVWLVAMVLEYWPDWCKVAVTLQNNGS